MVFEVSSSDLLKKLQVASGAISSNPVIPILEDFLFDLSGNELTISATNLEVTIISSLSVMGNENGRVAVPGRILLDTLKALPDQPVKFQVEKENNAIKLQSAYGEYKLSGDNAEDFPETPLADNVHVTEISSDSLIKAINNTIFATSNDELRLAMTGVLMQMDFNKVIFVSTDAHKLVKYTVGGISSELTESIIVPRKGLMLFKNAISSSDADNVSVSFNSKNIFFQSGGTQVISRLIDAKYPDYNAVIPVNNEKLLKVNRSDFQNSLKRIVIYSNKTTNQVVLNLAENSLTVSAQDLDFSNEATEQIGCSYESEPLTIGFNAKFLVEMLGVIETDEVHIQLSAPNKAGILVPSEEDEQEKLMMLIMPVMMSH
ncbi:MAG: DNA polymerase III subunit beta [Bacteroidia bacterium]|nr:DNA polymerase III subunit beta [Bacteroidia bacterium]MBT8230011.1 DNA polymerase III subunit beta [Bacteroidia bacterium]